jgi:hypothetical protein
MSTTAVLAALALVAPDPAAGPDALATEATPPPAPVVADVEQAVDADAPRFGYKKGFFIETADEAYAIRIQGRIQLMYTLAGEAGEDGGYAASESEFSIPRARFKMKGNAFSPDLHYALQFDMGKGFLSLKDAYVTYDIVDKWLSLRAGQFKKAFSRQQVASTADLTHVDRAITDKYFGAGRDIGVALMGGKESKGLQWETGLYNGTGDKPVFDGTAVVDPKTGEAPVTGKFTNLPGVFTPIAVGRVSFGYGGIKGDTEGDLEGGPLRFAVGTSMYSRLDPAAEPEAGRTAAEVDGIVKLYGFHADAALYASLAGGPVGSAPEGVGGHVQTSYVIAEQFMPALRYAAIQPLEADGELQQEVAAAFTVFLFGHSAKWSTDLASLHEGTNAPDVRARTQLQLAF